VEPIRGVAAKVVSNMEQSLTVPTATSVRAVPAKLMVDNRIVINNHLARGRGGKVSFTHIIGYAVVQALKSMPDMNVGFGAVDGKPAVIKHSQVNLGLAIDLAKPDGSRQLLVPVIKGAESMDFSQFWVSYEELVRKARSGKLTIDDFAGATASLTNPGTIGTVHSVPRLMAGQGLIVGVGAMEYPAEWQGASPETLAKYAVSQVVTLTSTYDHRIIQGAQSGDFLRRIHEALIGSHGFYDDVFAAMRVPYVPIRWAKDIAASHDSDLDKAVRVQQLIHAFRVRGHLMANVDPLHDDPRSHPDLELDAHGLTLWDLDREFPTGGFGGKAFMKLRDILGVLRDAYARRIGVEYMHISDPTQRRWLQERLEQPHSKISRDDQLRILTRLNRAEAFETFLQTKYVGQKRFSLEGGESMIALVDAVLESAADSGVLEVCIGMPHRGRLNVLANIAGKSYAQIFREFEGMGALENSVLGSGDVKYHLGTEGTFTSSEGNSCGVYLAANPSHLEAVNPVLEGIVRAKQDVLKDRHDFPILPVLLHGDAAFAGQGVVAETLHLSQLEGYRTGGTIHVIVNNQVGFTTSPRYSRSSEYCSDVARMVQAPVFHVNGDDPESVVRIARLAYDFRQAFHKDVVIDLVCYRRRGHNEADDPSLTQPQMYAVIEELRSVRKLYTESLVGRGDITVDEAESSLKAYQELLEGAFNETRDVGAEAHADETRQRNGQYPADVDTAITDAVIDAVVSTQTNLPPDFHVHSRLAPQLQRRAAMMSDDSVDWGMGETLAFGSLIHEGVSIRLAGQDSKRGTFGQRHAVIVDRENGEQYAPLAQLSRNGAAFEVYDSLLSEFAAMGFEYGYSVARPESLVMWEAQFGDFANGAQTIIDEFISSSEQKWGQTSGVVLLLPHGYEGQGPDHSSARLERYLAMCAQNNMTVAMPSTPASYFHLLRWQALAGHHKPLVVMTPKSLLRAKIASSARTDFTSGRFRPVIADSTVPAASVRKVLLASGKVAWDAMAERDKRGQTDVAVVRIERLAPLPVAEIQAALAHYPASADIVWLQEEPANQGAWAFMTLNLVEQLDRPLRRVSREATSAPSVGSLKVHEIEQAALLALALA
jgi:2-oxoglutarate dehydrogenase E1 component